MNPYGLSLLGFGFCSLLVGLFIWLKRQDAVGRIYFVFTVFNSLWGIFFGVFLVQKAYQDALFYARVADLMALFIPPTWFHFTLVYTGEKIKQQSVLTLLYVFSGFAALFGFTKEFIPELRSGTVFLYFTCPGKIFHFMTAMFATVIPGGFFLLVRKMLYSSVKEKAQIGGFVAATFFGFLGGGLTFPLSYGMSIPQYAIFLMPFYPFITAYFLIRRGLFDVEALAQAAHRDKLTAIGVLAASINHEVKNPLFIIKGLAENCLERQKEGIFLSKEKALESANDAMKRSVEQADRAMDIIRRLSLFAKAGVESEIKLESVSVQTVLEDILPLIRHELAAHSIALTKDIPVNLPEVRADRRYLEEIIFNLLVNAIQAIKETGKPGEITTHASSGEGKVRLTIQDNGPGIPEEKLKDVFRPFYTTKEEGTGLGLYITQQLVEKIKGRIDVQSTLGQGTVFTTILPAFASKNHVDKS